MKAKVIAFGEVKVDGKRYKHDLVIKAGTVKKRKKGPSKPFRNDYDHTPLSIEEKIPWGAGQLIVGTGVHGSLPIMPHVEAEAKRRGVKLVALPTEEACHHLSALKQKETLAVLHVTC